MIRSGLFILTGMLTLSTAQPVAIAHDYDWPLYKKSLAAGYKGVFTCGGLFNGGKTLAQIAQDELQGIRPELQQIVDHLPPAVIDYDKKTVSISYDDKFPARRWQWRPHLGCVQLPMGSTDSLAPVVPTMTQKALPERGDKWPNGDPKATITSANEALNAVVSQAFNPELYNSNKKNGQKTTAILITSSKKLIHEHYRADYTPWTGQRTWSTAKSIAATVTGVAVQQKITDVKKPASIPHWQTQGDPRQNITLENILHMGSGLFSGRAGNRTDKVYWGGSRVTETATMQPLEAAPGTRWKYANNDTMLVMRAVREDIKQALINQHGKVSDKDALQASLDFPFSQLFHKIGMYHTFPETDWGGNFIMSSQVWTTSRDLARLGILHLRGGRWLPTESHPNGEQILPENWVKFITTPAPAQPKSAARGGIGYGAQWWLYPNLGYASRGNRGQIMLIIPQHDLIIIRRGYDSATGGRFDMATFARDILKTLPQRPAVKQ